MLAPITQHLIATVENSASTEADIQKAAQTFFVSAGGATKDEVKEAMSSLGACFNWNDSARAGFLGLVCGALIEQGFDPQPIAEPLQKRLASLLTSASVLADACRARIPESGDENDDEDPAETFENVRRRLALEMPAENAAWEGLEQFWRPAIAVYSVSPAARAAARGLRTEAANIADYHAGGHWLELMFSVLDDEPFLAIEPATKLGVAGRISGIVENFQLNVLLMDQFPKSGLFARRRVPRHVAAVARGEGPQQTSDVILGIWNLYNWQAIESGLSLPGPGNSDGTFWIWNEGRPEDISIFEGRRVILLGPPSYARSWQSQRMFSNLPARLECERILSKVEVTDWLQRMLAAKGA
jgi:hypothetical protein